MVRTAVVGHLEWIEFARVERVPLPGEIVHALEAWDEPGGGGAVAAVQLAKLAGDCTLFTALGGDEYGRLAAHPALVKLGLRVETTFRDQPQRRGFVYLDAAGERTITVIGSRMGPHSEDPLDWGRLDGTDAVYATAGDPGAIRRARAARVLVGTARDLATLQQAGVWLDALVSSSRDAGERYERGELEPEPRYVVRTAGAAGGRWEASDGASGTWEATPPPGPIRDTYGAGDSFAAGLTYGLGAGLPIEEAVLVGARCGAANLTGRGPYEGQLTAADL